VALLTAVLTHLPAELVQKQLDHLRGVAPGSRFVACHGGPREDFDGLEPADAVWIEDPSLRGPHFRKSLNDTLSALHDTWVRGDDSVDFVFAVEYDHMILRGDFEGALTELAAKTGAGLLGKAASTRNDTNWPHYLQARRDERLNSYIAGVSVRDDPSVRYGCVGTGLLLRRDAFDAFCALPSPPPAYVELFVPTMVHHLGYDVVDVDAVSDLYADVRWLPEFDLDEVRAAKRRGRSFAHPFKRIEEIDGIR
jgi:hypothetical protein